MIKALLFDLDDTLYPERDYIFQGFRHVARKVAEDFKIEEHRAYRELLDIFSKDRYRIFDRLVERIGEKKVSPRYVELELLPRYRGAPRKLACYPEVPEMLGRLKQSYKLGLVSNGRAEMQEAKLQLLGLKPYFDHVEISGYYSGAKGKPSPFLFLQMLKAFAVEPEECLFVGDRPGTDGVVLSLGMPFVRIRRPGGFYNAEPSPEGTLAEINDLRELKPLLEQMEINR